MEPPRGRKGWTLGAWGAGGARCAQVLLDFLVSAKRAGPRTDSQPPSLPASYVCPSCLLGHILLMGRGVAVGRNLWSRLEPSQRKAGEKRKSSHCPLGAQTALQDSARSTCLPQNNVSTKMESATYLSHGPVMHRHCPCIPKVGGIVQATRLSQTYCLSPNPPAGRQ